MKLKCASLVVPALTALCCTAASASYQCGIFTVPTEQDCTQVSSDYVPGSDRIVGWTTLADGTIEFVVVENGTNVTDCGPGVPCSYGTFSGSLDDFNDWVSDYTHGLTDQASPTPEVETNLMMLAGLGGIAFAMRRRRFARH